MVEAVSVAVVVRAVSVACAAVVDHGVAAVAGSVADGVAPPAGVWHRQPFAVGGVGDLAPVFVAASADLAPAWYTSCPAAAGISDLPSDCLCSMKVAVGEEGVRLHERADDWHCSLLHCCHRW